jgi:diguanylate cyclase (GGDEF)-like protein
MQAHMPVLVVDDEISIQGIVSSVLSDDGFRVTTAGSGEQALELFAKGHFALVISDIVMPGMNGIELLKRIKQLNTDTETIIMTSNATLDSAIDALRSGAYDYLIKPFEDVAVITMVAKRAAEKIYLVQQNKKLIEDLRKNNEELLRVNVALKELAVHDGLTDLFNHRYFYEKLSAEIERSERFKHQFSLLFIDVDHFKKYNDANGHLEGDRVLQELSNILKVKTRKSDVVARYGGEEFVIILTEKSRENALIVAENIRLLISEYPFHGRERQPSGKITVSIGVSTFSENGHDPESLIRFADQALYRAKDEGRDRVC